MTDPNLDALSTVTGWSVLAAASRSIISEDRRSIIGFLRGIVMALFVGMIVNTVVESYDLKPAIRGAVVGTASFIADDILLMILKVSSSVRKDPKEAILTFVDYVFGRKRNEQ